MAKVFELPASAEALTELQKHDGLQELLHNVISDFESLYPQNVWFELELADPDYGSDRLTLVVSQSAYADDLFEQLEALQKKHDPAFRSAGARVFLTSDFRVPKL